MDRTCSHCQASFTVTSEDLAFYEKISPVFSGKRYDIPPPTHCPDCRLQHRLATCNSRNISHRTCDATGKNILSIYSKEKTIPVYENSYWWSDAWDAMSYGRGADLSRSILDQILDLSRSVPMMALVNDGNENAEYVNYCGWDRNCYLCFYTDYCEDCLYCQDLYKSKNAVDCAHCYRLELCYECLDCNDCFQVVHAQNCENCSDSGYLFDCISCQHCWGCTGLRQKKHCFLNEQLTKEQYEERLRSFRKDSTAFDTAFQALFLSHPRKSIIGLHNEEVSGNYLYHCSRSMYCFDCNAMEDSKFCTNMKGGGAHCYDITRWGHPAEFCYECVGIGESAMHMLFCYCCWPGTANMIYCSMCNSCSDCFACTGLRKKKYCILNRQYTKEEYEELVAKMIKRMQSDKEWGEFFPMQQSIFAYNESDAFDAFPLTKKEVQKYGLRWKDIKDDIPAVTKVIPASKLPGSIDEIPDDITNWAITCETTKRPFKIIKQELNFYRQMKLPVPRLHPDERHRQRMSLRNPRKLWTRRCDKCGKEIQTSYQPSQPETVFCEQCYLEAVY